MEEDNITDRGLLNVERFKGLTKDRFLIERDKWTRDFIKSLELDYKGELASMLYDAFTTGFMRGYDIASLHKNGEGAALIP